MNALHHLITRIEASTVSLIHRLIASSFRRQNRTPAEITNTMNIDALHHFIRINYRETLC
jgi:hypothetical protein